MFLTKKCCLFYTILFSSFLLPEVEKIFFGKLLINNCNLSFFSFIATTTQFSFKTNNNIFYFAKITLFLLPTVIFL